MSAGEHEPSFLVQRAVARDRAPKMLGRYCFERDQWVLDTASGTVPLVQEADVAMATQTRVGGEQPDYSSKYVGWATETSVGSEGTDRPASTSHLAMATITEVGGEQADAQRQIELLAMATVTKIDNEAADS